MGFFVDWGPAVGQLESDFLTVSQSVIPFVTGQTAESLNVAVAASDTDVTMRLQGNQIAKWLITGTAPHSIDAVNSPVLAFYWARMGRMFFGPHVNHPGTQPNDWRRQIGPILMPIVRERGYEAAAVTLENIRRRCKV